MTRGWTGVLRFMPELGLGLAVLIAVARITGLGGSLTTLAAPWLPLDPGSIDPLDAATAAFALGAVTIGIRRRKRLAWPLATAMFTAALVTQSLVLRHPLGAALALACLVVLVVDVRHYQTGTDRRMRLAAIGVMACGVAVLLAGSILVNRAAAAPPGSGLDRLATWAVETVGFIDPTGLARPERADVLLEVLEFAIGTAVLVAALAVLAADPDRPPAELLDRDRLIARRHASSALAPFQIGLDALLFSDAGKRGVVAYGRAGRTAVILGDPIGPPDAAWEAFRAFEVRSAAGDVGVSVYQASSTAAAELRRLGYRLFRVGEEAVLDLRRWDLAGSRRANVRHTVARAARGGISVTWHANGLRREHLERWDQQLVALDRAWQLAHGPAMRFTLSRFEPLSLSEVGIAVAVDASGSVQAFATFRRTAPGTWVLDLLRRRTDAIPGALESCVAVAATEMRSTGDVQLSLGLVALGGLNRAHGPMEERILASIRELATRVYDVNGLRFFKGKFDPEWRPRYGAIQGRSRFIPFVVALLRLHLNVGAAGAPGSTRVPIWRRLWLRFRPRAPG